MGYLLAAIIFFFGAALGSFIGVVADRYNTGLSFWKGRSFCFSCNSLIKNKDLFPVISFLWLRGKCRDCKSKIPRSGFMVEILMGILSLLAAFKSGLSLESFSGMLAASYLLLLSIFAVILLISVYDLRHFIIPDAFLIYFFIFAFLYNIVSDSYFFIIPSLLSSVILTIPFLLIFLVSKGNWIGLGDVKYIAVIGFFLGIIQGSSAIILAFWIGAAFSLVLLLLRKINPNIHLPISSLNLTIKSEIPFGPFLSIGIILSFYFNADLFQIQSLLNAF